MIRALLPLIWALTLADAGPVADLVTSLPGLNFQVNFKHYSGFLNAGGGSHFHYWFVESQRSPGTDPLLLWLNGGPGCSSMLGLLTENGPFHLDSTGTVVHENVYSWNKVASVVYIESPAGVGYSYADDGNLVGSDNSTMVHNYHALLDWFAKFPEFGHNSFFITGESYSGIYVPTLAAYIVSQPSFPGNFQGIAVGNGLLSWALNDLSYVVFLYQHGILGDDDYEAFLESCNLATYGMSCEGMSGYLSHTPIPFFDNTTQCFQQFNISSLAGMGLDPYNIYFACYEDSNVLQGARMASPYADKSVRQAYLSKTRPQSSGVHCREPFGDTATPTYLNNPAVRAALHIPTNLTANWTTCNEYVNEHFTSNYKDMSGPLTLIRNHKKRILIYNGDVDSACNFLGDQCFVKSLGWKKIEGWQSWTYAKDISPIAGYVERYQGIDFLTVRGSGHFVPTDKPREALQMLVNFLGNTGNYSAHVDVNVAPAPLLTTPAPPRTPPPTSRSPSTLALPFLFFVLAIILSLSQVI